MKKVRLASPWAVTMAQGESGCRFVNMALAVVAVLAIFCIQGCDCTGTLEIKVTRWQSNCADDFMDITPHCDPYFKFCIDKSTQTTCTYGRYVCNSNSHYHNTRELSFQDNICGISNPMIKRGITRFDTNEKVKLTTEVWDGDTFRDDHLVTWTKEFYINPQADSAAATFINVYTYSNGHHLWFYHRSYCDAYYYTQNCDVYCKAQDNVGGHYTCEDGTGRKICMRGWQGSNCDQDVNECQNSVCYNGGSCTNEPGSYLCSCLEHYSGKNCDQVISLCHSEPCKNNGTCHGNLTSYTCTCDYKWEGPTCQQQVNHCQSSPCYHGGTCYATLGNYTCSCLVDWTGVNCELEVNACDSNPCTNGATCDKRPGDAYSCTCPVQYEGRECQTLKDPCSPNPCVNSGACETLSYDQYNCTCPFGWVGKNCSDYLDLCSLEPCQNGGICGWSNGSKSNEYSCACTLGWKGKNCTDVVQACTEWSPCTNGGSCRDVGVGDYVCDCGEQFEDKNCSKRKDPCQANPCRNQGTCTEVTFDTYNCLCPSGFKGNNCQTVDALAGQQTGTGKSASSGINSVAVGVGVGCAVLLVLIVLLLGFLLRRRRQKKDLEKMRNAPDDLHGIVPVETRGTPNLAFTNDMYNNARNAQLERQASRPVPPTPTQLPSDDVFYPVKPLKEEEEGAVGGAPNPYAELDGYLDGGKLKNLHTDKKVVLDTRHAAGEEKAENPYHDFGDITRHSVALKSSVTEENPYHDLEEVAIGANGVSYSPSNDNRPNPYDNPSHLPPPLPHFPSASSSPYDLPHSDGENPFSLARSNGNAAKLPSPYDMPSPEGDVRAPLAFPNSGSGTDMKSVSLYDRPTSSADAASTPSPYDRPSSSTPAASLSLNAKHYDVPRPNPEEEYTTVSKNGPTAQQSQDDSSDNDDDDFDFGAAQEDIEQLRREARVNSQLNSISSKA